MANYTYESFQSTTASDIANLLQDTYSSKIKTIADISTTGNLTVSNLTITGGGNINNVNRVVTSYATIQNNAQVKGNLIVNGTLSAGNLIATNVSNGAQPNITSVGNLSTLNVTGGIQSGSLTTGSIEGRLNANSANQPNITNVGTLTDLSVTGTTTVGGIIADVGNIDTLVVANLTVANYNYANITNQTMILANKTITLAKDSNANIAANANLITANGSGLLVWGSNAAITFKYDSVIPTQTWEFNRPIIANSFTGNGAGLSGIIADNIVGIIADSNHSAYSNRANSSVVADSANAIAAANITGTINLATFAGTANAVAGANVSGVVANATYAATAGSANSVSGSNVTSAVDNAYHASNATHANTATTAETSNYANYARGLEITRGNPESPEVGGNVGQIRFDDQTSKIWICVSSSSTPGNPDAIWKSITLS